MDGVIDRVIDGVTDGVGEGLGEGKTSSRHSGGRSGLLDLEQHNLTILSAKFEKIILIVIYFT
jgi:hypothetical protein